MLQQTQVATVLPYYLRFVEAFPSVGELAAAPLARVLAHWSGLGYYRRAHYLHAAARAVIERHGGRFPVDAATLATLPGIGRATAAAIAAFAADARGAILDGNVKRVLARHRGIEGFPGEPRVQSQLWDVAETLLPPLTNDIAAYTQGLMDLGATICGRSRPRCAACPVRDDCVALGNGRIHALPTPRPRKAVPRRAVVMLLLERGGEVLLEQRPPLGVWGGLWSFPEAPLDVDAAAHVATRFDAIAGKPEALPALTHAFTHFTLTIHPRRIPITGWPSRVRTPGIEWFAPDAARAAAVPAPVRKLLAALSAAQVAQRHD